MAKKLFTSIFFIFADVTALEIIYIYFVFNFDSGGVLCFIVQVSISLSASFLLPNE